MEIDCAEKTSLFKEKKLYPAQSCKINILIQVNYFITDWASVCLLISNHKKYISMISNY